MYVDVEQWLWMLLWTFLVVAVWGFCMCVNWFGLTRAPKRTTRVAAPALRATVQTFLVKALWTGALSVAALGALWLIWIRP